MKMLSTYLAASCLRIWFVLQSFAISVINLFINLSYIIAMLATCSTVQWHYKKTSVLLPTLSDLKLFLDLDLVKSGMLTQLFHL